MLLVGGAIAAIYAYDSSQDGKISKGVKVGGVDVSGMDRASATRELRARLLRPLREPVIVRGAGERFELAPREAKIRMDIDGMVDSALSRSRSGSVFERTYRNVSGEDLGVELPLDVSYDRRAVDRLIDQVDDRTKRDAKDASVDFASLDPKPVKEERGRELRRGELRTAVVAALEGGGGRGGADVVRAQFRTVQPKITRDELAQEYPLLLIASKAGYEVKLYKNLKLEKTYPVAFGAPGYPTPDGLFEIQDKTVDPTWNVPNSDWAGDQAGQVIPGGSPENPLKARWMGFDGGAGFHGTADVGSLGSNASHGCIRMDVPDVIDLYDRVEVGTPVYIG